MTGPKFSLWLFFVMFVAVTLALGLSSITVSRATTVAILIAYQIIILPIVGNVGIWGWLRDSLGRVITQAWIPSITSSAQEHLYSPVA